MDIGLALPQFGFSVPGEDPLSWRTVEDWAFRAEVLGFDSVWLADHVVWSIARYGGPETLWRGFDPFVGLGALAATTTRVRLGVLVVNAALRPPTLLAKRFATLERIAGAHRVVAGMGAGYFEPEFEMAGVAFGSPPDRLRRLETAVETMRAMWASPVGTESSPPCLPAPLTPGGPPVWIGGKGDRLLDVAARAGDVWNTVWAARADQWAARNAVLDAACERAGRDPSSVGRSLGLSTLVGEDRADLERRFEALRRAWPGVVTAETVDEWAAPGRLVGTVDEVSRQLAGWAERGVAALILNLGAVPFSVTSGDELELAAAAISKGERLR